MEYSELISFFLSFDKSLLISPAGYGKTYTIAECVKNVEGKSLILTHTHAGIASIKKKLNSINISKEGYQVETITSYAQKYVRSYYTGEIPEQDDNNYWKFVLEQAENIFRISHIKDVIQSSYKKLFIDEYQDCTISQHKMILALADILPVHILGDPLQGIMEFGEELVDFYTDLNDFEQIPELTIPYRWYQEGNNKELGDYLKETRQLLLNSEEIHLKKSIQSQPIFHKTNEDILSKEFTSNSRNLYKQQIQNILKLEHNSLLIILPEYNNGQRLLGGINDRVKIKSQIDYSNQLYLLEAIDDKSFYSTAKTIDDLIFKISTARKKIKKIKDFLEKLFNKTEINNWLNDDCIKNKRSEEDKLQAKRLEEFINSFIASPCTKNIYSLIAFCKEKLNFKIKRYPLYKSIMDCLLTEEANKSVYQAMVKHKNKIRRVGRKVEGKCIGTTALTKGLEFDTVVILDAHNFKDSKNLYVALTRASKNLIIFSKQEKIKYG